MSRRKVAGRVKIMLKKTYSTAKGLNIFIILTELFYYNMLKFNGFSVMIGFST